MPMPASGEFKLSISQALTDQLQARLKLLTPELLTQENLSPLKPRQGVYQLYVGTTLVYIGSAAASLPARLRQHLRKISGRQGISIEDVGFTCLYVDEDLTVLAPEDRLIAVFREAGVSPWNFNGFGNKDPGRNRDATQMPPEHFDRLYPMDLNRICEIESGSRPVAELLAELKAGLPFLFRFERSAKALEEYQDVEVTVPEAGMSAEELLGIIAAALPDFQVTALPGYVIMYRERRLYPDARIIGS